MTDDLLADDPLAALRRAPEMLKPVVRAFDKRLSEWGATARGVYWRNEQGQRLRFEVLARALAHESGPFTVNDLGCGYGAFFDYLAPEFEDRLTRFTGYDIAPLMLAEAKARIKDPRARFVRGLAATEDADYSFASGTFNMCLKADLAEWTAYIEASLAHLFGKTRKAMAFNMLTGAGTAREGLYYADPAHFVLYCQKLGKKVQLAVDYPLLEWTIFVHR